MNELKIKPIEKDGQRVLTTAQLAEFYGTDSNTIKVNFNRNKDRYIEGKHFYRLTGDVLKEFKENVNLTNAANKVTNCNPVKPNANTLYLWTERGALLHAKSLNTDKAWEVYDFLVENYFRVTAIQENHESLKTLKYSPTREITTDDYLEASRTVAKCHNSRLPIVLDLLEKAGLDIKRVENKAIEAAETDDVDLVNLLNQFTLHELLEKLPICKTSIYYYRIGKVTPNPKRREEIIRILGG